MALLSCIMKGKYVLQNNICNVKNINPPSPLGSLYNYAIYIHVAIIYGSNLHPSWGHPKPAELSKMKTIKTVTYDITGYPFSPPPPLPSPVHSSVHTTH